MSVPTLKQAPIQEHTRILGLGAFRPDVIVTNEDVCQWIDSSDEWIRQYAADGRLKGFLA